MKIEKKKSLFLVVGKFSSSFYRPPVTFFFCRLCGRKKKEKKISGLNCSVVNNTSSINGETAYDEEHTTTATT